MPEIIRQVFFDFKCPLCRLSKSKKKYCLGIFMHYFSTALACPSLLLCSFVPGSASDRLFLTPGRHRTADLCASLWNLLLQFIPSLQLHFLSLILFPLPLPLGDASYLCSDIISAELNCRYQQRNSRLLRNYCSCSFQSIAGVYGETYRCHAPCWFCMEERAPVCVDVVLTHFTGSWFIHPFFVLHSKVYKCCCVCNVASDVREN